MATEPAELEELELVEEVEIELDDTVRCRACSHDLTTRTSAIEVAGGHDHTFRNPAGYSWHIVCFADAPGCSSEGSLTTDATWFAGFAWCFASCGRCANHLGWWYVGGSSSFVGLIASRIA